MVLIKEMEMPINCESCRFNKPDQLFYVNFRSCAATTDGKFIVTPESRKGVRCEWCPLIEVEQYGPKGTLYKEKRANV